MSYSSLFNLPNELVNDLSVLPKFNCSLKAKQRANAELRRSRPNLYVIEATSLDFTKYVLHEFDDRVTKCLDEIGPGVYLQSSLFLFLLPDTNSSSIKETIFSNKNVRLHRRVSVLEQRASGYILAEVFNFYKDKHEVTVRMQLGTSNKWLFSDMFPDFDMNVS